MNLFSEVLLAFLILAAGVQLLRLQLCLEEKQRKKRFKKH